jgi:hypothetical protein
MVTPEYALPEVVSVLRVARQGEMYVANASFDSRFDEPVEVVGPLHTGKGAVVGAAGDACVPAVSPIGKRQLEYKYHGNSWELLVVVERCSARHYMKQLWWREDEAPVLIASEVLPLRHGVLRAAEQAKANGTTLCGARSQR